MKSNALKSISFVKFAFKVKSIDWIAASISDWFSQHLFEIYLILVLSINAVRNYAVANNIPVGYISNVLDCPELEIPAKCSFCKELIDEDLLLSNMDEKMKMLYQKYYWIRNNNSLNKHKYLLIWIKLLQLMILLFRSLISIMVRLVLNYKRHF